ncbi:hypothetical protein PTNB73_08531 [Pyrenophora teres f. teres]|nr:hypothetical protein PTNB73_08531 [Pyrenophora teres f. teres]
MDKLGIEPEHRQWFAAVNTSIHRFGDTMDPSHDYQYIRRIVSNAANILHNESKQNEWARRIDPVVIWVACMIHDVSSIIYRDAGEIWAQTDIVNAFLEPLGCPADIRYQAARIVAKISYTSEMVDEEGVKTFADENHAFCIVQDAVRLDKLGAVGVSRFFSHEGNNAFRDYELIDNGIGFVEKRFVHYTRLMKTETGREMAEERYKWMLIEGSSSEKYSVYNPTNDEIVGEINLADAAEVDAAVAAAREAYENGPWSKFNGAQRAKVMLKLADLIEANGAEITKAEVTAMGQPTSIMGGWIVPMVATTWRYYAGWADKIEGQTYPLEDGAFRITQYEPYGVCAGIGPWNVSIMTMAWKMAPALAAGNTFVFKGSEKSPFSILVIARLFEEAGFPPGVVNILTGAGKTGALLAGHMDIDKISFTGSGDSGKKVVDAANKSNMKRVTLELGGKSPSLVFDDADFDAAIAANSQGFLFNSGQACIATSRLFVQSNIADKFIATLKTHFEGAAGMMGDPSDVNTRLGPLADTKQLERVLGYIEAGKTEAKLLVGGERKGDKGAFVTPTIFLNPGKDSTIYKEEIFGPVLSVLTFDTEEEAIKLANDISYGLSAAIYTENLSRALRASSKIKAGTIGINSGYAPDNMMPFGGYKQSGMGRELGKEGLLAYMQSKSIRINL